MSAKILVLMGPVAELESNLNRARSLRSNAMCSGLVLLQQRLRIKTDLNVNQDF